MSGDLRVVEDGATREAPPRRQTSAAVWVGGALVVGVLFGVVMATTTSSSPVEEEPEPVTDAVAVDPLTSAQSLVGVTTAIDGFTDAMVGVARTGTSSLSHILWPIDGEPITWPLAVGGNAAARFDASGTWLAATTDVPDSDGSVLTMGKPASMVPIASNVTSFAWHDSAVGVLAYTQEQDGVWSLVASRGGQTPLVIASGSSGGGAVVAWGNWGFAIQDADQNITLLNANAEIRSTASGTIFDSISSGWLLLYDGDFHLLSAGGGMRKLDVSTASIGGVETASLSPNGEKIAVMGSFGVKISAISGDMATLEVAFTTPISKLSWSSDSRFLIMPFLQGVIVIDTDTGRTYEDLVDFSVIEVGVIPLDR